VEKLAGRFVANQEKWGDDEQFPQAVYEEVFPGALLGVPGVISMLVLNIVFK